MTSCKKPIRRSMLIYGVIFLACMCALMSIQSAGILRGSLDRRHVSHLQDVVTYVEHITDADDLRECINTLTPSENYNRVQQALNTMVDDFEVRFIYIVVPSAEEERLYSVISSTSNAERAAGEEDYPIMYSDEDFYTAEQLVPYIEAWGNVGRFTSFKSYSDYFGPCYTVCKPLQASDGEVVALVCADLGLDELHSSVNSYIWSSIGMIVFIALLFALSVSFWLKRQITDPLQALEASARKFAEKSHDRADIDELAFDAPDIHTENEIQSLSETIAQMSEDMKGYVEDFLSAERRAESAEEEVEDITKAAYEDTQTGAKSRVAYDAKCSELMDAIAAKRAEFALVMVGLNNTKNINEIYGLERGSRYIVRGYEIVQEVYEHSSVFRIGGDEFVAVLENEDYKNRDELFAVLEERFAKAQRDTQIDPWERCSAAAGMTEFFSDSDEDVGQVYRRAEMILTRNKRIMKSSPN